MSSRISESGDVLIEKFFFEHCFWRRRELSAEPLMRRVTLLTQAAHIKRALASYRPLTAIISCLRRRRSLLLRFTTSWLKREVWRLYTWLASEKALAYIELLSTPGQAIDLPPKSPQHFVSFLASRMLGATAAHLRDPAARASVLPRTDELTPQGPRDWATGAFLDCSGLTPQVLHALPIMDTRSLATREFLDNAGTTTSVSLLHIGVRDFEHIIAQLHFHFVEVLPSLAKATWARARRPRARAAPAARPACARARRPDTDWEMALMAARCVLPAAATAVVQAFRDALNHWCEHDILLHRGVDRRHDRLGDDADGAAVARRVLLAIEVVRGAPANAQHEPRQRFTEVVGLGCEGADAMQVWLDEAADHAVSVVNALVLSRKIK
ncbi:hypothetical protein GGX14DRAFT_573653 [Mycena pura]|uniref:Uncharacterized protein n=1 Tax=Mycena pura TaxID=153505 RepID=A0AAD6V5W8_9AGAR|nr:hypothetical protein GGX14DRAFT_573653 [Mycena pura]